MPIVKRTALAEDDLIDIWLYIARDNHNLQAADKLLDRLDEQSKLLASNPKLGRPRGDIALGLRYFVVDNYLILYRIISNGIEAVRYVNGAHDLYALQLQ